MLNLLPFPVSRTCSRHCHNRQEGRQAHAVSIVNKKPAAAGFCFRGDLQTERLRARGGLWAKYLRMPVIRASANCA